LNAVDGEDDRLRRFLEDLTGGRVVSLTRQVRWRPAWFADVRRGDDLLHLHVRGDRRSDVLPFPSLQREADILRVLEAGGIPVPHVHGMCSDPLAIVMDAVPGVRDVTKLPAEQAQALAEEYIELLAKVHRLDVREFAAIGLEVPNTPERIGLGMLTAYLPLYRRTKAKPEPLVELAIAWATKHVPRHRTVPSFVHFDAGQFLHDNGQITALYDFETCLVGDPMMDLAALRMRDPAEPIGADLTQLFRHYAQVSGAEVDLEALRFHTVVFALVGVMALAGTMVDPLPGSPHSEYLWWDLMQRRTLVWALAECAGVQIEPPRPAASAASPLTPLLRMVDDAVAQLAPTDRQARYQQRSLALLVRCALSADSTRQGLNADTVAEISAVLGRPLADLREAEEAAERAITAGGREDDPALIQALARQVERECFALAPLAERVAGYNLAPAVL
jgi:aminoglycoside phosphotransferase (APT) family kinase protein